MAQYFISLSLERNADAFNNIGQIYAAEGNSNRAMEHYLTALSVNPKLTIAHFNLGVVYLDLGMKDKARIELEKTLELCPDHIQARSFLNYLSKEKM